MKEQFLTDSSTKLIVLLKEKPFIWLTQNGRYYIELGDTEIGAIIRIDNFLNGLEAHLQKLEEGLAQLEERESSLEAELRRKEDLDTPIEELKRELENIDKKLGVKK